MKVGCRTVGGSIEDAVRASGEKVGRAVEGGQQARQVASPANICDATMASTLGGHTEAVWEAAAWRRLTVLHHPHVLARQRGCVPQEPIHVGRVPVVPCPRQSSNCTPHQTITRLDAGRGVALAVRPSGDARSPEGLDIARRAAKGRQSRRNVPLKYAQDVDSRKLWHCGA